MSREQDVQRDGDNVLPPHDAFCASNPPYLFKIQRRRDPLDTNYEKVIIPDVPALLVDEPALSLCFVAAAQEVAALNHT